VFVARACALWVRQKMVHAESVGPGDLERHRALLGLRARRNLAPALRSKLDPDDLVQEALLRGLEKLGQFQGRTEAELGAWLLAILRTTVAMSRRRLRAAARDVARERPLPAHDGVWPALVAGGVRPDEQAQRNEQRRRLAEALRLLPPSQRWAVELHHLQGRSLVEVAGRLHTSLAAVNGLLTRGLSRLRILLAEAEGR
jgi:RNA polymerase sigma-70 factor (ECF subfamily)